MPRKGSGQDRENPKFLTPRQQEVEALVVKGRGNREIGDELGIDIKTVKFHLSTVYRFNQVKSRAQLIVKKLAEPQLPS